MMANTTRSDWNTFSENQDKIESYRKMYGGAEKLASQELKQYFGRTDVGRYIVYVPDLSYLGKHKKNIWKVTNKNTTTVTIKNITTNDAFTTSIKNVIDVQFLIKLNMLTNSFITEKSLETYKKMDYINNPRVEIKPTPTERKENNMNKQINNTINENVLAAKDAARLVAGKTLNSVISNKIAKQLPRKYRKLAGHPIGDVVIANIASVAVQNFASTNYKAKAATEAMMRAAMFEFVASFNFDQIVAEALEGFDLGVFADTND